MKTATPAPSAFPAREGARSCCWAAWARLRRGALRQHRVRQGDPQPALGTASAARYGLRKARARLPCARSLAAGLAESAHDLSDGGLARSAQRMLPCPGDDRRSVSHSIPISRPSSLLFGEAPSRILLSTSNPDAVATKLPAAMTSNALAVGVTMKGTVTDSADRNSPLWLSVSHRQL